MRILDAVKKIKGSGLKYRLLHCRDEYWEFRLNVRTIGFEMPDHPDGRSNYASPYSTIAACLRRMQLGPDDVFVDLGCGYGRPTLFAAGRYRMAKAVGIDLNPAVIAKASENARSMRDPKCKIEFLNLPAQEYDFSPVTAVFMYNPFGEDTMRQVLATLRSTLGESKTLRIAYVNPQYRGVFAEADWLKQYAELRPSSIGSRLARPGSTTAVLYRGACSS